MDLGATHQRILAACVVRTAGPVLELGAGYASTPLLHGLCGPNHRTLRTVEQAGAWAEQFAYLKADWHVIECAEYAASDFDRATWDVAFVDHAPASRRVVDVRRLKSVARLIVIHDTESTTYGYHHDLNSFRFQVDDRASPTWTSVVSDVDDLSWLCSLAALTHVRR